MNLIHEILGKLTIFLKLKPRTNYLKRSLSYDGVLLWNSLPEEIRSLTVFSQFKKAINDYYAYSYR